MFFLGLVGLSAGADAATHVLGAKQLALGPSTETVNAGYYQATTLSEADADLEPGNIKIGVTIFGKLGTYTSGYALPDTGQTVSYATTFDDDSYYNPAGAQPSYTIQNPVGVSSVTVDNRTGLMWLTNPVDAGISGTYALEAAITTCEGLSYATYSDWRVANIKEMMSIVDYSASAAYFVNTGTGFYWSSTTYQSNTIYAWLLNFNDGSVNYGNKTTAYYLRCVRAGP